MQQGVTAAGASVRAAAETKSGAGGRAVLARRVVVGLAALAYAAFFSLASVLRHETLQSGTFDLAFMDQALWNTIHGVLLGVSIEPGTATSELGYHFEPILIPIAALYWLYSSPDVLLVLQSVVLALGALPASWLAYRRLGSNVAAVVFALAYLLYPGLEAANMFDFHAFALAAPFLLFAFYFLERKRYPPFAVAAVLAMATKENVPLTIAMFGLYLLVIKREVRPGLLTIAGAAAWFLVASYVIIPAFNHEGQAWLWNRYGGMGGSPLQVVGFLLTHPERLLEPAPGLSNVTYVLQLLFPLAFLSLLHPATLLLAAPGLATNLLTVYDAMHLLETYHYTAGLVPIVVISAVYGLGVVADGFGRWLPRGVLVWVLATVVLGTSLAYHYYRGYTPLSPAFALAWPNEHDAIGRRLAASIPAEASVAAQANLGPHVSERARLSMFPDVRDADYIFLDVASQPNAVGFDEGVHRLIRQTVDRPDYGIVAAEDGFLLLRRGAPHRELPDEFFSFARAPVAHPSYPLRIQYGDAVELLGFDMQRSRDARVELTLYWRALRPLKDDLLLAVYLADGQGKEQGATVQPEPANFWYPTSRWRPGEVVRQQTLRLPWFPGEQDFALGVGVVAGSDPWDVGRRLTPTVREAGWLVDGLGNGTIVQIATFRNDRGLVTPRWRARPADASGGTALATFAGRAELVGFAFAPEQARAGRDVRVELRWRVLQPFDGSYTTFVHVLAPGPKVVAQKDSPPVGGRLPTTFWLPGDGVADSYVVPLPPTLAPGEYQVEVGLYDPRSGARLPLVDAAGGQADHLILPRTLVIGPP